MSIPIYQILYYNKSVGATSVENKIEICKISDDFKTLYTNNQMCEIKNNTIHDIKIAIHELFRIPIDYILLFIIKQVPTEDRHSYEHRECLGQGMFLTKYEQDKLLGNKLKTDEKQIILHDTDKLNDLKITDEDKLILEMRL